MKDYEIDEYYEIMIRVMDIQVKREWEPSIKAHLSTAAKMARIIEDYPIDDTSIDLANTFHPGNN